MITRKSWNEFASAGMLWFINRLLHVLGWVIVFQYDVDGKTILDVYPARCRFRGFDEKTETEGFIKVSDFMKDNAEALAKEAKE
jgi:hypothetical protein